MKNKWVLRETFVAIAIYALVSIGATLVQEAAIGTTGGVATLIEIVITLTLFPLGVGLGLLGIRRAAGKVTLVSMLWEPYSQAIPLIVMFVFMTALIVAGFFLLILPGIYLSIAYSFAPYLIVEKDMGVWEAMETSRNHNPILVALFRAYDYCNIAHYYRIDTAARGPVLGAPNRCHC